MKFVYFLGASLLVASPALAQGKKPPLQDAPVLCYEGGTDCDGDQAERLDPDNANSITVTGLWTRIADGGQSVSVISAADLAQVQGADLSRALERLPGVNFARNGGLGSASSLFVRGASSEQLLVMIDGVRMQDTASPSGGFDLGTLMAGGLGRVELLRGSNSMTWGSDAIGGVLAASTDTRSGLRAGLEYGAHDTVDANLGWGLSRSGHELGLTAGYTRTDGISAYAGGTEADPFRQWHLGGRGSLELGGSLKLVAAGRYADSKVDFDGYPAPAYSFADTPEYQITRQGSGRVGLEYQGSGLELSGGVALSDTRRAYYDPTYGSAPNFETAGRSVHADLKGRADLTDGVTLDFGSDADWSRFSTTFDPRQTTRTVGGHALLGYHGERLNLTAGARIDDHDRFGSHWTFGANGSFDLTGNLRLRASFGQGFKAPTLYQLYGYGGNATLKPEQSDAYDLGLEYAPGDGSARLGLTLFRRDSSNLIDYVWPSGYTNISRTRAQGVELEGRFKVTNRLSVRGAYTWLEATNRLTGKDLARRPRNALSLSYDWRTPLSDLALGADFRLAGDRFDDAGNFTPLDGYALVTLRASMPLGEHLELYGRVENVTDESYETSAGYGSYGRTAYAGIRVKW
ncbi:TonB-dependent receptor [Novosphingobium sp.]|uniref:TonB-dependent receptor plug domain-containing protein n=1 Tax=Novosphingobium sp. TaxID=1874826 RepID=UPI0025E604FD|nr:TonB-dependent receptor [Novosphingobium sp.]MCC6924858.1 TonB-dependent receptor [Novosphingobium sp.]